MSYINNHISHKSYDSPSRVPTWTASEQKLGSAAKRNMHKSLGCTRDSTTRPGMILRTPLIVPDQKRS